MIIPQWLELPMSRTNFLGPKDVRAIEVRLYIKPLLILSITSFLAGYERLFHRIPNHIVTIKHQRNIQGLTVEECARRCLQEMTFNCRGFDYETRRRNCWLTDKGLQDTDGLKKRSNTDFYERKSSNLFFLSVLECRAGLLSFVIFHLIQIPVLLVISLENKNI